jgi:hypothetical protein
LTGGADDPPVPADGHEDDLATLLGRDPAGSYEVVVRDARGAPVVIVNEPLLHDGTPMPTRYWLVDPGLRQAVSRLESAGGVRRAEAAVDQVELAAAHERYAAERDAHIPPDHRGPVPSGGVGGTRRGVKCLHAHLAWWLVGGDDPVGRWTAHQLGLDPPGPGGWRQAGGGVETPGGDTPEGDHEAPDQ